jgi:hypothetical protein
MNNFALFICGIVVTLLSGMGVLVYMVSLGYKRPKVKAITQFVEPLSTQIPSPS